MSADQHEGILRISTVKRKILKIFFFILFIPGGLFALIFQLNKQGFFNVQKIEIEIDPRAVVSENFLSPYVNSLAFSLEEHKGESLIDINLKKVFQKMDQLAWIDQVNLSREWPSTLKVKVLPKEVKFLQIVGGGKMRPILADGKELAEISLKQAPDVTLLRGEKFQNDNELRKKAIQLLNELPQSGPMSSKNISEVGYDSKNGFWLSLIEKDVQVKMGDDQFALKSARVAQVLDYMDSKEFKARVIDANLSQKVLVRLRKDP
jgi:cell division protein FtsQ